MYDLKGQRRRYAEEQRLVRMQLKHVKRMDRIRAGEGDWGEILTATLFALVGFAAGAQTMYYILTFPT